MMIRKHDNDIVIELVVILSYMYLGQLFETCYYLKLEYFFIK